MARINVYARDTEAAVLQAQGKSDLVGWFDDSAVTERVAETTYWDGNNHRGMLSRLRCGYEELLRTAKGRWVRHHDGRREFNGPEYYEFLTDEQARDWLLRNEGDDQSEAVLKRYFGETEEETGPNLGGRPEVGPAFSVRFPRELTERIDAARGSVSRAEWLRQAAEARLAASG